MRTRSGSSTRLLLVGALLAVLLLAFVWAAAPSDERGWFLLVAGVLTLVGYGALFAVQRSRHW